MGDSAVRATSCVRVSRGRNDVWCFEVVDDALVNGETFRCLLVKDEASVYALAIDIARSFNAKDVTAIHMRPFRRNEAHR